MDTIPPLQVGDILLYNTKWSFVDWAIRTRTWSDVAHIEISLGNGTSVASRNGIGVGKFLHRREGLVKIRRLVLPLDFGAAMNWFTTVDKTNYGWTDLFRFYGINVSTKGIICSTFADLWLKSGGIQSFAEDYPPEIVSPRDFETTTVAKTIYGDTSK
jgi:hypothetical protein